ncbi:hypothetical protein Q5Y75_26995 [Ruegeria sp. 2205SS24-7]|uniref:hypothetical protein n=1 Tax=Ruegeria discodermiae TaxID=3064389 RepID=UPI002741B6B3|nr:hypothetical protein [Ruegeria sp. 2205SS24-7]MDP5220839.1 hypothetical protein [Ruegeria sp. 2205SS24-7]
MTHLDGIIRYPDAPEAARVQCLDATGKVITETVTDAVGTWQIDEAEECQQIVVHTFKHGILVAAAPMANQIDVTLPAGVLCTLACTGAFAGAQVSLDPVALEGLETEVVAALPYQADGTKRLNVGDWMCQAAPQTLRLQRGRYRLAGGVYAVRAFGAQGASLSEVTVGGVPVAPGDLGTFTIDISAPTEITLTFTENEAIE